MLHMYAFRYSNDHRREPLDDVSQLRYIRIYVYHDVHVYIYTVDGYCMLHATLRYLLYTTHIL